jgi:hypothetical protein
VDHVYLSVSDSDSGSHEELRGVWREGTRRSAGNRKEKRKEECKVRLYERAGCFGEALVEVPFARDEDEYVKHKEEAESECVVREFVRMSEVWVRVDCGLQDGEEEVSHGAASILEKANASGIVAGNSTANSTNRVSRRWQKRRLSLLGR